MAGLSRMGIGKLAMAGYPGHIFVCKLRYGYGQQSHIEKLEILHNWYSDLRAYLPVLFEKKPEEYDASYATKLTEICEKLNTAWELYQPGFEGAGTCTPTEKAFIRICFGVKETLDEVTAQSRIIEGQKIEEEQQVFG